MSCLIEASSPFSEPRDEVSQALEELKSPYVSKRRLAAQSIVVADPPNSACVEALAAALFDDDLVVRMVALDLLASAGRAGAEQILRVAGCLAPEMREDVSRRLQGFRESILPELLAFLQSEVVEARLLAATLVGHLRKTSLERIDRAWKIASTELTNSDAIVRQAAVEALGVLGESALVSADLVVNLLRQDIPAVRCAAAATVGSLGGISSEYWDEACLVAAGLLGDSEPLIQLAAAKAIGRIAGVTERGLHYACHVANIHLTDERRTVRIAAAKAFKSLLASNCCPPEVGCQFSRRVAALLDDDEVEVQCAAASALGTAVHATILHRSGGSKVCAHLLNNSRVSIRLAAAAALGQLRAATGLGLAHQAASVAAAELANGSFLRVVAAQALGNLGSAAASYTEPATRIAEEGLFDADVMARLASAVALSSLRSTARVHEESACEVAVSELGCSTHGAVRASAARAMAAFGSGAASHAELLAACLHDEEAAVRSESAVALGALGTAGFGFLQVAMRSQDWKVRIVAAKALEAQGYDASPHVPVNRMRDA